MLLVILACTSLPDSLAYKLIRAVHKGEEALGKRLAQAAETTAVNTASGVVRQDMLHPGVLRYLREIGLVRQPRAKVKISQFCVTGFTSTGRHWLLDCLGQKRSGRANRV